VMRQDVIVHAALIVVRRVAGEKGWMRTDGDAGSA
jgi:hypothetical protein